MLFDHTLHTVIHWNVQTDRLLRDLKGTHVNISYPLEELFWVWPRATHRYSIPRAGYRVFMHGLHDTDVHKLGYINDIIKYFYTYCV